MSTDQVLGGEGAEIGKKLIEQERADARSCSIESYMDSIPIRPSFPNYPGKLIRSEEHIKWLERGWPGATW